jgi:hypothetical protein
MFQKQLFTHILITPQLILYKKRSYIDRHAFFRVHYIGSILIRE